MSSLGLKWLVAVPAPAFYVATFLAAMAVERVVPMRLPAAAQLLWLGWALIAAGVLLGPGSAALFAMRRTTLNPIGRPSQLVTGGAYGFTRNPMYLGLAVAYVGVACVLHRGWPLLLLPAPLLLLNFLVIPFEEARMQEHFGEAFLAYCGRVRRWV